LDIICVVFIFLNLVYKFHYLSCELFHLICIILNSFIFGANDNGIVHMLYDELKKYMFIRH